MTKSNQIIVERATDGVAVGAVTSPIWLDYLTHVSEVSALVLPIFGAVWLLMQMWHFIKNNKGG